MSYIRKELFRVLSRSMKNNDRDWFQKNKPRYERDVKEPLLQFISDFGPHLRRINPHLVADPRPVGGSLFRIHRDVRFSTDKSPYKTHAGVRFPHEEIEDRPRAGLLPPPRARCDLRCSRHLAPRPGDAQEGSRRDRLRYFRLEAGDVSGPARGGAASGGDSLKKVPRGYDPEHPFAEDLKRKDFIAYIPFTEADACAGDFMKRFGAACGSMKPLLGFLSRAVGASW